MRGRPIGPALRAGAWAVTVVISVAGALYLADELFGLT
jgi:hypothetical protein